MDEFSYVVLAKEQRGKPDTICEGTSKENYMATGMQTIRIFLIVKTIF